MGEDLKAPARFGDDVGPTLIVVIVAAIVGICILVVSQISSCSNRLSSERLRSVPAASTKSEAAPVEQTAEGDSDSGWGFWEVTGLSFTVLSALALAGAQIHTSRQRNAAAHRTELAKLAQQLAVEDLKDARQRRDEDRKEGRSPLHEVRPTSSYLWFYYWFLRIVDQDHFDQKRLRGHLDRYRDMLDLFHEHPASQFNIENSGHEATTIEQRATPEQSTDAGPEPKDTWTVERYRLVTRRQEFHSDRCWATFLLFIKLMTALFAAGAVLISSDNALQEYIRNRAMFLGALCVVITFVGAAAILLIVFSTISWYGYRKAESDLSPIAPDIPATWWVYEAVYVGLIIVFVGLSWFLAAPHL